MSNSKCACFSERRNRIDVGIGELTVDFTIDCFLSFISKYNAPLIIDFPTKGNCRICVVLLKKFFSCVDQLKTGVATDKRNYAYVDTLQCQPLIHLTLQLGHQENDKISFIRSFIFFLNSSGCLIA